MDNHTRWNSWYKMLLVLLSLKTEVENYCDKYESELQGDLLSREDWKKLEMIKDFLKPFNRATLAAEGDSASIDHTLFNMDIIIQHIQEKTICPLDSFTLLSYPLLGRVQREVQEGEGPREQGLPILAKRSTSGH